MTALTDVEILAALPIEARRKIDSSFEALSQSLPSDKERIILYRVAHTLKLNPTDTHFSMMAAMHYYLQLYQDIPNKIAMAGDRELKAQISALKDAAESEMAKARDAVIGDLSKKVGAIAQRVAGDAAAAERSKAIYFATAALAVCALVFGGTGYVICMAADEYKIRTIKKDADTAATEAATLIAAAEKKSNAEIETAFKNAGWAGTQEGRLAKKFFDSGAGEIAAKCDSKAWEIIANEKGKFCVPKLRTVTDILGFGDGNKYGWEIP
ncbi:MAG: hypothetical protein ACYCTY_13865 [Sulfuricella sp.]